MYQNVYRRRTIAYVPKELHLSIPAHRETLQRYVGYCRGDVAALYEFAPPLYHSPKLPISQRTGRRQLWLCAFCCCCDHTLLLLVYYNPPGVGFVLPCKSDKTNPFRKVEGIEGLGAGSYFLVQEYTPRRIAYGKSCKL